MCGARWRDGGSSNRHQGVLLVHVFVHVLVHVGGHSCCSENSAAGSHVRGHPETLPLPKPLGPEGKLTTTNTSKRYAHAHAHGITPTHTNTCTFGHMRACARAHTHTDIHAYTHAHTRTDMHAHTQGMERSLELQIVGVDVAASSSPQGNFKLGHR